MKRLFKLAAFVLPALLLLGGIAAAALPGAHRMLAPEVFGFEQIAPNVYAPSNMQPDARAAMLRDLEAAQHELAAFYGAPVALPPRVVLCPGTSCNAAFGKARARATAYGRDAIRLNELGLNRTIAIHELSHIEMKRRIGRWADFTGAMPAWFDEGLAVELSRDARFEGKTYPPEALRDLRGTGSWWTFGDTSDRLGWRTAYGGSAQLVRRLRAEIGDAAVLSIAEAVGRGVDFEKALRQARR